MSTLDPIALKVLAIELAAAMPPPPPCPIPPEEFRAIAQEEGVEERVIPSLWRSMAKRFDWLPREFPQNSVIAEGA